MSRDAKARRGGDPSPQLRGVLVVLALIWTGVVLVNVALGDVAMAFMWAGVGISTTVPVLAEARGGGRRAGACRDRRTVEPA